MKGEEQNPNETQKPQSNIGAVSAGFNIGDEVELKVYNEICCEICYEILTNYIDCPVCKGDYVELEHQTGDLNDQEEVTCEECGATFAKTSFGWYFDCKAKIVSLGKTA